MLDVLSSAVLVLSCARFCTFRFEEALSSISRQNGREAHEHAAAIAESDRIARRFDRSSALGADFAAPPANLCGKRSRYPFRLFSRSSR